VPERAIWRAAVPGREALLVECLAVEFLSRSEVCLEVGDACRGVVKNRNIDVAPTQLGAVSRIIFERAFDGEDLPTGIVVQQWQQISDVSQVGLDSFGIRDA